MNPDFGQVEADPAVVNLTAFETFFSERRPFFVEGTGLYRFELNCYIVVDCSTNEGLFYSRRIGRSPSLRDDYGDATTPTSTPIAAATKLTGRTTQRPRRSACSTRVTPRRRRAREDRTVEPLTNYAVLRAQQDLRGGDAGHQPHRDGGEPLARRPSPTVPARRRVQRPARRSAIASTSDSYELAGQFAASHVTGTPAAIAANAAAARCTTTSSRATTSRSTRRARRSPVTPSSSSSANTAAASRASRRASCGSRPASR